MTSECSMTEGSETEDGHDSKFMNLKIDRGDTGKKIPLTSRPKEPKASSVSKKSVMFSVGQEEVTHRFKTKHN